jgi:peptidyl-prolyl cis-trans isomerase D
MLTNIRKAADSWWFKAILILVVITFCWGISDMLRGSSDDKLVTFKDLKAITGHEFISAQKNEINRIQNMTGQPLSTEQIQQLNIPNMVLEQLINGRMLGQLVQQYDIDFSNNLILGQIKKLPVFQNEKGIFDPKLLKYVLQNAGMREEDYIKRVKNEIAEQIIISMFASNALAPLALVDNVISYFNESRTIDIVSIDASNVPLRDTNFPIESLKNYYEIHKQDYTLPEKRSFAYGLLSKESLKKDISATDKEAEQLYKDNIDEYKRPELFSFYNLFFADFESARKASDKIKSTSNFEDTVESIMGRPAGEFLTQRVPLNGLDNSVAATLKTSALNSQSGIVKTNKGYHVIRKVEQVPAVNKNFVSAKSELIEVVKRKKLEQKFVEVTKQVEDELAAGSNLAEIAKKFNLKLEYVTEVTSHNFSKKLGNVFQPADFEKLFALKEGEVSDIIELSDKHFAVAIVEVTKVIPEQVKNFDEVKDVVVKGFTQEQKFQIAYNILTDISKNDEVSTKDKSNRALKLIANYKLTRADLIDQQKSSQYPKELLYTVFLIDKGAFTEVFSDGKSLFAAKVKDIALEKSNPKLNKKAIEDKIHTNFNNSIFEEIILDLRNKNKVKVSDKINSYITDRD